jgi:hypothetical protein
VETEIARAGAPLVLWRCAPRFGWVTEATCAALKARDRIKSPVVEALRISQCVGCPRVVALHHRGKTRAPRVLEIARRADICTSSPKVSSNE